MRAVNLIAGDGGRARGAAGIGPFVLLGVLGLLLAGVVAYVLTSNALVERRAELASLTSQAQAAQAQAQATRPYLEFASLAQARVETVRELGRARFDWDRAFDELARVLPEDVWLTSLLGTVTTGITVDGAGAGTTGTLRAALPNPAIELLGCTTGHTEVARLISRLRLMTGVVRVSLADSAKADEAGGDSGAGGAPAGGNGGDCRNGNETFPQFGIVVFFDPVPTVAAPSGAPAGAGSATPAAATPATPPPTATPAATGSPNGSDMR